MTATERKKPGGGHDSAHRRKSNRRGRQKGVNVYIPGDMLAKAGYDPNEDPPLYRVWGSPRGRVVIQLYKGD